MIVQVGGARCGGVQSPANAKGCPWTQAAVSAGKQVASFSAGVNPCRAKLQTAAGRAVYARRKTIPERVRTDQACGYRRIVITQIGPS